MDKVTVELFAKRGVLCFYSESDIGRVIRSGKVRGTWYILHWELGT